MARIKHSDKRTLPDGLTGPISRDLRQRRGARLRWLRLVVDTRGNLGLRRDTTAYGVAPDAHGKTAWGRSNMGATQSS
jgi:hypothetical protein